MCFDLFSINSRKRSFLVVADGRGEMTTTTAANGRGYNKEKCQCHVKRRDEDEEAAGQTGNLQTIRTFSEEESASAATMASIYESGFLRRKKNGE